MSCTPTMESNIQVLNPDGTVNEPISQDGSLFWEWILPNSTINYRVLTKPNGYVVGKDEANFQIWCNNKEYLLQETDRTYARANDELQQIYLQEIIDVSMGKIESPPTLSADTLENLNMDRLAVLLTSKNFNTDENGIYEGTYKIPSNSTVGQYAFIISYGYDEAGKSTHNQRQKKLVKQIILTAITVFAIILIAILCVQFIAAFFIGFGTAFGASVAGSISTALGVSGVAAGAIGVGLFAADIMFYEWLGSEHDNWGQFFMFLKGITEYPTTGKNKEGCEFANPEGELGPIVHIYGGIVCPLVEFDDNGNPAEPPLLSDNMKSSLAILGAVGTATLILRSGIND